MASLVANSPRKYFHKVLDCFDFIDNVYYRWKQMIRAIVNAIETFLHSAQNDIEVIYFTPGVLHAMYHYASHALKEDFSGVLHFTIFLCQSF